MESPLLEISKSQLDRTLNNLLQDPAFNSSLDLMISLFYDSFHSVVYSIESELYMVFSKALKSRI